MVMYQLCEHKHLTQEQAQEIVSRIEKHNPGVVVDKVEEIEYAYYIIYAHDEKGQLEQGFENVDWPDFISGLDNNCVLEFTYVDKEGKVIQNNGEDCEREIKFG